MRDKLRRSAVYQWSPYLHDMSTAKCWGRPSRKTGLNLSLTDHLSVSVASTRPSEVPARIKSGRKKGYHSEAVVGAIHSHALQKHLQWGGKTSIEEKQKIFAWSVHRKASLYLYWKRPSDWMETCQPSALDKYEYRVRILSSSEFNSHSLEDE